jgi:hypothetical protein
MFAFIIVKERKGFLLAGQSSWRAFHASDARSRPFPTQKVKELFLETLVKPGCSKESTAPPHRPIPIVRLRRPGRRVQGVLWWHRRRVRSHRVFSTAESI